MRKHAGFTLIELMIVVAIVGIMAAIAIPNFLRYQMRARYGEVKDNVSGIFKGEESFKNGENQLCTGAPIGQYVAFANAIPVSACAGPGTSKQPWVAADNVQSQAIDWQVQGNTYGCYNSTVTAPANPCAAPALGGFGLAMAAGGETDIDGDAVLSAICLWQPLLSPATGTPAVAAPACPVVGAVNVGFHALTWAAGDPLGQTTQVSLDSVF